MQNLHIVAGSKGGVGKTICTFALADYLQAKGKDLIVVDSDTSNPDVFKAFEKTDIPCRSFDLDANNGWIDLVSLCNENPDFEIVVNTAARNNEGVQKYAALLSRANDELNHTVHTFWVINRQQDSLELLEQYLKHMTVGPVHVVRNNFYGSPNAFGRFEASTVKKNIINRGGAIIDLSELGERVTDYLNGKRIDVGTAAKEMPLGHRCELGRWQTENEIAFNKVFEGTAEFIAESATPEKGKK